MRSRLPYLLPPWLYTYDEWVWRLSKVLFAVVVESGHAGCKWETDVSES